ncbi:metallophosphoesterase [Acetobacter pasteurianus]|uniref:metallophosphoesterase n=1 Tax=Acetobacter pasteurianus TaxID=438 RepID=UPI001366D7C5|nr:metallophosphoesterase [Acetobacter pasteurianus]
MKSKVLFILPMANSPTIQIHTTSAQPLYNARAISKPEIFITDVHGQLLLMKALVDECLKISNGNLSFLGDMIDRGKDSAECLAFAISLAINITADPSGRVVRFICGNHEEMLISAIREVKKEGGWEYLSYLMKRANKAYKLQGKKAGDYQAFVLDALPKISRLSGGKKIQGRKIISRWPALWRFITYGGAWFVLAASEECQDGDVDSIITRHLTGKAVEVISKTGLTEWLVSQPNVIRCGDIVATHGGIPSLSAAEADPVAYGERCKIDPMGSQKVMESINTRWVRKGFIDRRDEFPGYTVLHGHTIDNEHAEMISEGKEGKLVSPRAPLIGIDSGAYKTGVLTAAILEKGAIRFVYATMQP